MTFIVTGDDGQVVAINQDHIVHAKFHEKRETLSLVFVGGTSLELTGVDATEVWKNIAATEDEDNEELDAEDLKSIEEMAAALEKDIARNRVDSLWEVQRIEEFIEFLPDRIPQEFADRTARLRERVSQILAKAEICYYTKQINECNAIRIATAASINSLLRKLNEIEDALSESNLTDDLVTKIREAKERVAWHRTKKKLDESTIAEAGGGSKKASKLAAEAGEILKQDWAIVFPGETPPPISSLR